MKHHDPSKLVVSGLKPTSKSKTASTAILLALAASCAHGALSVQVEVGLVVNAPPTGFQPLAGDLLETSVTSVTGENAASLVRNGSFTGAALESNLTFPAQVWGADPANAITTYGFNLSTNPFGYDVTFIQAYSAWDVRASQNYRIFYAQVGAPTTFIQLGPDINVPAANVSVISRTLDDAGASLVSNVSSIRFQQLNTQESGYLGGGTVYRELDVQGFASVPEPTTSMFGLGAALVLLYRRRR